MAQKRRRFSPQFKAEAVQFALETGRPSRRKCLGELGITKGTFGNWAL